MIDMKKKAENILEDYADYYSQVDLETLAKFLDQIKSEAIKEFAHQLKILLETKAKLYSLSDKDCEFAIVQNTALKTVDNLVLEMVGDTE